MPSDSEDSRDFIYFETTYISQQTDKSFQTLLGNSFAFLQGQDSHRDPTHHDLELNHDVEHLQHSMSTLFAVYSILNLDGKLTTG
jgi:hypothetical protein